MSQIINELAAIEVSNDVLEHIDLGGIYQSFHNNYKKLDDLKNFRSDYEKKNWLIRGWHNDKLRDAQLDSAEVQAEFSKTIGQLMMISILQSKKLSEHQTQLNEQQSKLKKQANGIAEHAGELQEQHKVLADQSAKLESLVHEYFALKGLTEDGAQRLIEIAKEVKSTKEEMLQEFAMHARDVEVKCGNRVSQIAAQANNHISESKEEMKSEIVTLQHEIREVLAASESALRNEQHAAQQAMSQNMQKMEQKKYWIEAELGGQSTRMIDVTNALSNVKIELVTCIQQQQSFQGALGSFQYELSRRIKNLGYVTAGLSVAAIGMLGGMAHLLRWI